MNYRMLEMIAPRETVEEALEISKEHSPLEVWTEKLEGGRASARFLVKAEKIESLSDAFANRFSEVEGFRLLLYSVEATIPVPDEQTEEADEKKEESGQESSGRISREELYADVSGGSESSRVYVGLVILSSLVAAIGLVRNDVAVIIGAMVIAPLLGPNVSMALAVTLGDLKLGWKSLKTNLLGLTLAFAISYVMGLLLSVDPQMEQVFSRASVSLSDITIAIAAGSAGVLAYTRGVPAAIVGVMVAVALLPPLVNMGLLLGAGYSGLAAGAGILTATNLICINLAGVVTFLVQGVRPRTWWEAEKARKSSRIAIVTWALLLILAGIIIWYWG